MKIGIVGQGFVGTAVRKKFEKVFEVVTYDKDNSLSNRDSLVNVVNETDIMFVCVPTPMHSDGSCDTSIVEEVIGEISELTDMLGKTLVKTCIIKSTVPPGTTTILRDKYWFNLGVVFIPEFLTEANANYDFENQDRIIIGGDGKFVTEIFTTAFPGIPIITVEPEVAEMLKYVTNIHLAMKVSFANEMYALCQKLNIDWNEVIKCAKMDVRLGKTHWNVPGPDGDFGFGGHCFPKDLGALSTMAHNAGVLVRTLDATQEVNDRVRSDRDWERMIGRAVTE